MTGLCPCACRTLGKSQLLDILLRCSTFFRCFPWPINTPEQKLNGILVTHVICHIKDIACMIYFYLVLAPSLFFYNYFHESVASAKVSTVTVS